ncbi:SRPBCC family protein [Lutimonas halocynthiae]|uniref:SRPBCC family protein n=1 Tax=Lutimonas halocynthiae TaxID=1446477 RepID=UPI0025B289D4|nr:SRPBCC family protein [Lutimonas halocynthiae]MDN3641769.1 SRPBCC family protein [Lutimonas halocynthiae]
MKKLRTVSVDIMVNSTKAKAWDVLFNRFGEVNAFNPLIEGSHFTKGNIGELGCERQCDLDSKNSIHEKIVAVRGDSSFDIEIIQGGLPMIDKMKGTIDLKEILSNQTLVTATIHFNTSPAFMGSFLKGMIAKMFFKTLVGLKFYLETDAEVTKENIKDIMKTYKMMNPHDTFSNSEIAA